MEMIKKKNVIDAKAMNTLYCGLNADEFNMISMCSNVKEIWNSSEVTVRYHQVKESTVNDLI